jgi:antitoxin (DNA-binding transcriptional repressor) of toxin-antitoxin stability system
MKSATVRDIRNEFSRISKWLEAGETVQVLKRGKPYARVIPEPKSKCLLGCMTGTAKLPPDIDAPVNIEWEAAE